jgi:hypothetical protein
MNERLEETLGGTLQQWKQRHLQLVERILQTSVRSVTLHQQNPRRLLLQLKCTGCVRKPAEMHPTTSHQIM